MFEFAEHPRFERRRRAPRAIMQRAIEQPFLCLNGIRSSSFQFFQASAAMPLDCRTGSSAVRARRMSV